MVGDALVVSVPVEVGLAAVLVLCALPRTNPDIFGVTSGDAISVSLRVNK